MTLGQRIATKIIFSIFLMTCIFTGHAIADSSNADVVIYQVQAGTQGSASSEYISIYNNSDNDINITNWCLVYSSASDKTQNNLVCFKAKSPKSNVMLSARSFASFATNEFESLNNYSSDAQFSPGIAATAGHIKLVDEDKTSIDVVGWGSAVKPEGTAIKAPAINKILQRKFFNENIMQDTNINTEDFIETELVIPQDSGLFEQEVEVDCPSSQPDCANYHPVFSEVLPDPIGADGGNEFIEIHNPYGHAINLEGYVLQLGPSFTKQYRLKEFLLKPNEYIVLSDTEIGFSLPNTKGSLRLINKWDETVDYMEYANAEEGKSVAYINGEWLNTYSPTPGYKNEILDVLPCELGKIRNPETGRCIMATKEEISKVECKPNQERNPETGRCKAKASAKLLTACKPNQTRNPETGRCKNISSANTVKPCQEGQERSKETNRCRKISSKVNKAEVKDVESPMIKNSPKWWIAGIGIFGAVGYAVFEWRRELFSVFSTLR